MIPSLTLRADNAFAVPLLEQYAVACRRWAEQYPSSRLVQRAEDADRIARQFQEWQDKHPKQVKMERTLTTDNPGVVLTNTRRRLQETRTALDRAQRGLSAQLAAERERSARLATEVARLQARAKQAAPITHATPSASPR